MLALLSTALVALSANESAAAPERPFALVVAKDLAVKPGLAERIERYCRDVKQQTGIDGVIVELDEELEPAKLRKELQSLAQKRKIQGAFLLGRFRFAQFRNAVDELATFPEYYEDLDGTFGDDDHDGVFDHYDPWTKDRDGDALEIWIAAIRPYAEPTAEQELAAYFDKLHATSARDVDAVPRRATIFTSKDWAHQDALTEALTELYGAAPEIHGGLQETTRAPRPTSPTEFALALACPSRLLFVFAHSGPSTHHLDQPDGHASQVVPTKRQHDEQVLLEDLELGARAVVIWGCHGLDLEGVDYPEGRFLANSYCLTPKFECQTVLGAGRSIGMESLEVFTRKLRDEPLPAAWLGYANHLYREEYLREWLGVRGAWKAERGRFNWSYLLYGNPFADLAPARVEASAPKRPRKR